MNVNASIWMKKVQRFSLMLLLSGLILVQFMQMASASHFSFDDQMTNSGSVLEQDHKGHLTYCKQMMLMTGKIRFVR